MINDKDLDLRLGNIKFLDTQRNRRHYNAPEQSMAIDRLSFKYLFTVYVLTDLFLKCCAAVTFRLAKIKVHFTFVQFCKGSE